MPKFIPSASLLAPCAALLLSALAPGAQAGPLIPAKEFRMDQLKVTQSAEAGHWVHSSKSQPPQAAFPAQREEGCMSQAQLRAQLSSTLDGNACDMEVKQNDGNKAVIAMHCKVAAGHPAFVLPLEIARLGSNHFQAKVGIGPGAAIVHDYQRTQSCKAAG